MRKYWIKLVTVLVVLTLVAIVTARYFALSTSANNNQNKQNQAAQTSNPAGECAQCHEMRPEVLTWQVTAHEKFACTVCHVNKKASDYVGKHQSQAYSKLIKIIDSIPNSVCLQCHAQSSNRTSSPTGDLRIPHEKHLDAGVSCIKCHYGVAHAKIAERDLSAILTDPTNYEAWTIDIARKVATKPYILPSMWSCIDCHKQAKVTRKCGACHTTIPTLPSHDQPTWRSEHGKYARNDLQECINCHAAPGVPTFIPQSTGDKATDFARAQQFCSNCHLKKPEMHEKSMVPIHPKMVAERGPQDCVTCHNLEHIVLPD